MPSLEPQDTLGISRFRVFWPAACRPSDVVAVVRTRGKAADLAARGVRVREADYSLLGG
jgi:hypothetical protein